MKKLLIATRNEGKLVEIKKSLEGFDFDVVGLDDIDIPADFDVEEPAMTFEGNALIKALSYGHKTNLLTLSEDTGLEVDALNGRPGVYSARWVNGSDEDRYIALLKELEGVSHDKMGAQFRTVVALYDPSTKKVRTCEGVYRGEIIVIPRGGEGFGYDPIFLNTELNKTNAEMSVDEKNKVSHRGKALRKAKEILLNEYL